MASEVVERSDEMSSRESPMDVWMPQNPTVERTETALSCGSAAHLTSVRRQSEKQHTYSAIVVRRKGAHMVVGDDGDIIRGLGFVALYSAYLEEALDECLEAFGLAAETSAKLFRKPASAKVKYCIEQAAKLDLDQIVPVAEAFQRSGELFELRNDVVHGRIYSQSFGPDLRRSGRLGVPEREISSAELYELANSFYEAVIRVSQVSCFYIPEAIRNEGQGIEAMD